jgi:hypothetical protein
MSLQQFQLALAVMTIQPILAAKVKHHGAVALQTYDLTALEQRRLLAVSQQPGMELNCTLARANRFGPILDVYPKVCTLIKPWLRELLDIFWIEHLSSNYQLSGEEDAFAVFLQDRLATGHFKHAYLREVLDYETACWQLIQATRQDAVVKREVPNRYDQSVRDVHFSHNPSHLLPPLQRGDLPTPNLPPVDCWLRVQLEDDALVSYVITHPDASSQRTQNCSSSPAFA